LRYRFHNNIPLIRLLGASRDTYQRGARLIGCAVDAQGTDLVNRIWKDTSLLPTPKEIAAPETWVDRIAIPAVGPDAS
jgi:uncharacterized protein (DUF2342 family)